MTSQILHPHTAKGAGPMESIWNGPNPWAGYIRTLNWLACSAQSFVRKLPAQKTFRCVSGRTCRLQRQLAVDVARQQRNVPRQRCVGNGVVWRHVVNGDTSLGDSGLPPLSLCSQHHCLSVISRPTAERLTHAGNVFVSSLVIRNREVTARTTASTTLQP